MSRPETKSYRIYLDSYSSKATHIVHTWEEVEAILPRDRSVVVKQFSGRRLWQTYLVNWTGLHFKGDPCYSEADH